MVHEQPRLGAAAAAFLLVIPGMAVLGTGVGMLIESIGAMSIAGVGAGLVLWGLIVVGIRRRESADGSEMVAR